MRDVAAIIVPWAVVTLTLFALLDWDESRLTPEQLARAWPPSSRTLAIVYFGVLAVPIHFWRTRRSLFGVRVGIAAAFEVALHDWAVTEGLDRLPEAAQAPAIALALAAFAFALVYPRRKRGEPLKGFA